MPAQVRPNTKAMKIAYKILETPKELKQTNSPKPDKFRLREWDKDSATKR
jgi:hypothetical protein